MNIVASPGQWAWSSLLLTLSLEILLTWSKDGWEVYNPKGKCHRVGVHLSGSTRNSSEGSSGKASQSPSALRLSRAACAELTGTVSEEGPHYSVGLEIE